MAHSYYIGLDIGGTKIEAAILSFCTKKYCIHATTRLATNRENGIDNLIAKIAELCLNICQNNQVPLQQIAGIGIGLPGSVDPVSMIMLAGNTQILEGVDLRKCLYAEWAKKKCTFHPEIIIANDANCFALAEARFGAGLSFFESSNIPFSQQTAIGIILGTGTGGGVVQKGQILSGATGGAFEFGHTILRNTTERCYCGETSHAEQFLCGPAIEKTYFNLAKVKLSSSDIFKAYSNDDKHALSTIDIFKTDLVTFLSNLTNLFAPHYFVLGGGVSSQKILYPKLEQEIAQHIFIKQSPPQVYQYKISDSAGVIGAVIPFLDHLELAHATT